MSEYDTDFAAWSDHQAAALRRRAANEIDWENIAEEIESLGRSDRREIRNRLAVICEHLLKWAYQPEQRSSSWRGSVIEARQQILSLIEESPSLEAYPAAVLNTQHGAYLHGRAKAMAATEIGDLPETCPWSIEQLLDDDYWPLPEQREG
jgi:hypothetical protein